MSAESIGRRTIKRHSRQSRSFVLSTNLPRVPSRRKAAQCRTVSAMSSPGFAFIATATVAQRPICVLAQPSFSSLSRRVMSVSSASGPSKTGPDKRKSSSTASSFQMRLKSCSPPSADNISLTFFSPQISISRCRRIARRVEEPGLRSTRENFSGHATCGTGPADSRFPVPGSSSLGSRLTTPSASEPSPRSGSLGGSTTVSPMSFRNV